jgi:oligopeptide/dipeptide ABC transporter ATP-binding protein
MSAPILEVRELRSHFPVRTGLLRRKTALLRAVDGVDLSLRRGECLGLVGESGCGKTTLARSVAGLLRPTEGTVRFTPAADPPLEFTPRSRWVRSASRRRLQMVFQDPVASLNPRMLVREIVAEPLRSVPDMKRPQREAVARRMVEKVGLGWEHLLRYPHELSGGQRQRIAVARALAARPELVVLDEPTSALDVSVQAQVLGLLRALQRELRLSYLFVTHHLLVVRAISNRVAVMYLGKIVETAPTADLFDDPRHPYTAALLSAIPRPKPGERPRRIPTEGETPSPISPPLGCRFHPRCPFVQDRCRINVPVLEQIGQEHWVACHRREEVPALLRKLE